MHLRARHRRRLSLLLMLALAWAQLAVAAHACSIEPMPTMAEHCGEPAPAPHAFDALCASHCAPADVASASLPPMLLAALPPLQAPALEIVASAPAAADALRVDTDVDPPPLLRFCSLLI